LSSNADVFKGVVHGKIIELERAVNLPEGEQVTVVIRRATNGPTPQPGEGLRRAFGSWADDGEGVDQVLEQLRRDREQDDRMGPIS
jgi:hypothetical protein